MKKFVSALVFSLLSLPAFAVSHDEQVELELEAAALATLNSSEIPDAPEAPKYFLGIDLSKPLDFFKNLRDQVESIKETLVSSYDENGNGKIDAGTEFDNFREGTKLILTLIADKNQNGKIDAEDLGVLTKEAFAKVRAQTLTKVCPFVYKQVEFAGIFLKFNPLLVHFDKVCTEHDLAIQE